MTNGPHEHEHGGNDRAPEHDHGLFAKLFGHAHAAADQTDTALEASARGIRVLALSLVGLGATATVRLVIALASGSAGLLADTIHNGADALTALPLFLAFRLGRRAPNRRYTYGYGRAEDLAGVFIVAMIAISTVIAGWTSLQRLLVPQPLEHVGWVIVGAIVGFIGNEAVAVFRIREGKRIGSAALEADGHHARADGLASVAVLAGAGGVLLGFPLADPLVGLLISVLIAFVLKNAATDIYRRLMDAVDPALVRRTETVLASVDGVEGVEGVRIRWVGHNLFRRGTSGDGLRAEPRRCSPDRRRGAACCAPCAPQAGRGDHPLRSVPPSWGGSSSAGRASSGQLRVRIISRSGRRPIIPAAAASVSPVHGRSISRRPFGGSPVGPPPAP